MFKLIITKEIKKQYLKLIFYKDTFKKIEEKIEKNNFEDIKKYFKSEKMKDSCKKFCNKIEEICDKKDTNECIYQLLLSNNFEKLKQINKNNLTKEDIENFYKNFRKRWAYKLVELLNIKVCPYCNRNFITNFSDNKTSVELDHFYPISKYPHLALNLYNLIPVCNTCNKKKGNKSFKIYPYKESIDDYFYFIFEFNSSEKLDFFDEKRLILDVEFKREDLGDWDYKEYIKEIYQNHRDIISEILKRENMYPESYIEELIKNYEGILFNSKDELRGLIHCNYIDKKDINKRPLAKLTKDILIDNKKNIEKIKEEFKKKILKTNKRHLRRVRLINSKLTRYLSEPETCFGQI